MPSKKNWSDVGFDLSIIKKLEDFNTKTSLYDTGLKIQLDFGYYAEIVPRSSMSKSGYILANSIGIIDNSYRGNLMIALTKIADDAIEINYPYKCCQLIIKKQIDVNLEEVAQVNLTKRNNGGFGSTD
jgi:dUTP pyrophosphatase